MKLLIFGATGKTGKILTKYALAAGHDVVIYIRNPAKITFKSEFLTIIHGELTDDQKIENAIKGVDVVLSVLGPKGKSHGKPLTHGIHTIITAMKQHNIKRLIITSTLSAKDPHDLPNCKAKFMVNFVKLVMRTAYEEIVDAAQAVRVSDLDWTILRLTLLNDNPKSGTIRVGYLGKDQLGTWLSRADLAEFMLNQINDLRYLRQARAITN